MIEDDRDKAIMEWVEGIPNSSFHLNSSLITWGMRGRGHLIKIKKKYILKKLLKKENHIGFSGLVLRYT